VAQHARDVVADQSPVSQTGRRANRYAVGRLIGQVVIYAILLLGTIILMFPIFWMIRTSVMPTDEIEIFPIQWLPSRLALDNFAGLFATVPIWGYLKNSVIISVTCVVGTVFSSSLVGFSFARMRFPGRGTLFIVVIATAMIPYWVLLIPQFIMFQSYGWIDTFAPLILPQIFAQPFNIFLTRQFFLGLSNEVEEAAKIDGCSYFRIYWNIALPMIRPVLVAIATFTFLATWNNLLRPL
jgi:ABC-type glycerol-3-phosphate transport system permease component